MKTFITASRLYDLVACPHRVGMDLFGDPSKQDDENVFIKLLWERGTLFERETINNLKIRFLDLSIHQGDEKERRTKDAMEAKTSLIYGGRISADDLLGDPDLLRWEGNGYVPGDIKSGAGEEGDEENGKPKTHYAVQLGLYVDILERKGISAARRGFIWDIHGEEVIYDFESLQGKKNPQTLWTKYLGYLEEARNIVRKSGGTHAAYGAPCKHCHWLTACMGDLCMADDLTLIPELGRSKRDAMSPPISNIKDFADTEIGSFIKGKKTIFAGIGPDSLKKFHRRAKLVKGTNPQPQLLDTITFPEADLEIFFDVETDPLRDICYLHGFIERHLSENNKERYVSFFADEPTPEAEEKAFKDAWEYLQSLSDFSMYYYSKYERTSLRKLQRRFSHVCSDTDIEDLFHPSKAIDLYYDVVKKKTDWPTIDFSIKTLAKYLGFHWRDTHPSGAASIEWYHRWVESHDQDIKQRILIYNQDDCLATRVLLDGLKALSTKIPTS